MTIDINELRRLAQTVQSPAHKINERVSAIHKLHDSLPSGVVLEILNRLEEAEADALEQARLNGVGASREAALMAKLEAAEKNNSAWLYANAPGGWIDNLRIENEALRAKIAEMERQEPVAWMCSDKALIQMGYKKFSDRCEGSWDIPVVAALPGAKGEKK